MLENCGQVIQQEDESGAFGHDSAVSTEILPVLLLLGIAFAKFSCFEQEDARAAMKLMIWKQEQDQRAGKTV